MASLISSSFLLWFQICSQLSTRLEKQQAATKEELDIVRVSSDHTFTTTVKKIPGNSGIFQDCCIFCCGYDRLPLAHPPSDVGVAAELLRPG